MQAANRISVVIPCFNAERYIASAVGSVLAQHGPEIDVIVVDDGSSDRSAAVVRQAFPEVTVLQQGNRGVAAARNLGIRHSTGEWIAFLDADDVWLAGKLEAQCEALKSDPAARMVCSAWEVWPSADAVPSSRVIDALRHEAGAARWDGPSGWIYHELLLDCAVWTSTVLVQRALLEELGGFDEGLRVGEDYDLWLRASRLTPILRVARPLALYRTHPASITRAVPTANYRAAVVSRAIARWGYASPDGRSARKRDVENALARSWSDFAGAQLDAGNLAHARRAGWMALRSDCRHVSGWKVLAKSVARTLNAGRDV